MTFTSGNRATAQTVTVRTKQRDKDWNSPNHFVRISGDFCGNGTTRNRYLLFVITNTTARPEAIDNDDITITGLNSDGVVEVEEFGKKEITLKLDVDPGVHGLAGSDTVTATVTVQTGEGGSVTVGTGPETGSASASLTFSTTNWNVAQTMRIFSVPDADSQDTSIAIRVHTTQSNSTTGIPGYHNAVARLDINVKVNDNDDSKHVLVNDGTRSVQNVSSSTINEGGSLARGVRLVFCGFQPTISLNVGAALESATGDFTVSPSTLTFSSTDWSTAASGWPAGLTTQCPAGNTVYQTVEKNVTVNAGQDDNAADETNKVLLTSDGFTRATWAFSSDDDETAGVRFNPTSLTITEGGNATTNVTLDVPPDSELTLEVSRKTGSSTDVTFSTDSSATSGGAGPSNLTFSTSTASPAAISGGTCSNEWNCPHPIKVFMGTDEEAHVDEATLEFSITGGGTNYSTISVPEFQITETENQTAGLTVTEEGNSTVLTGITVDEKDDGTATGSFDVKLSAKPTAAVTVSVTKATGSSGDVTLTSGNSLSFTTDNWNTAQTVTVGVANDLDGEDETATINLTAGGAAEYAALSVGAVTVSVDDNDTKGLTFSPTSLDLDEGDDDGEFTVVLDTQPTGNVTVTLQQPRNTDVTVDTDTSTPAVNDNTLTFTNSTYVSSSGTSCTTQWNCPQTVTVSAAHDGDADDEQGSIRFTPTGGGYDGLTILNFVVDVDDDEESGIVAPSTLTVTEGGSNTFTVKLGAAPTGTVTVTLSRTGTDSADVTFDTDGSAPGGATATLTFTTNGGVAGGWDRPQTVTVYGAQDDDGSDDTATIRLTPSGGGLSETVDIAITVDDDEPKGLTLAGTTFFGSTLTVTEPSTGSATATFTVKPSTQPKGGTVSIRFALVDIDDDGTPSSPDVSFDSNDLQTGKQTTDVMFNSGNWGMARTVTVYAAADADALEDRAKLELTASGADYAGISETITVNITEAQSAGIEVTPASGMLDVDEGDDNTFTVKLSSEPSASVTVNLSRVAVDVSTPESTDVTFDTDGTAPGGTTASLTFDSTDWQRAQTVTVYAASDDDAVVDKAKINLAVDSGTGASEYAGKTGSMTVTVDEAETPGLTVSQTGLLTLTESTSSSGNVGSFTVVLDSQPSSGSVTVTVTSNNADLAIDTDTSTTGNQNTLTFNTSSWNVPQSITLTAGQDDDGENDSATVTLTAGGADYGSVTDTVAVSITDDDPKGINLPTGTQRMDEEGSATFVVSLKTQPTGTVTVTLADPTDNTEVTVDTNSFESGEPNTLTFTDSTWNRDQTVTIRAAADDDLVADSATINVSAAGGGYTSQTGRVAVMVRDTDTASLVVASTLTVAEGGSQNLAVKLSNKPADDVTVTLTQPSNTDVKVDTDTSTPAVNDNTLTFTNSTYVSSPGTSCTTQWNCPQTVTVSAAEDHDAVADSAAISMSAGSNYGSASASVDVSVTENDSVGITVEPSLLTVTEEGSDTFTVVLDSLPAENVTVTPAVSGNDDVELDVASLTFTTTTASASAITAETCTNQWNCPQTVTVSAAADDDTVSDPDATITLSSSSDDNTYDLTDGATVTVPVTENDSPGLSIRPASLTVAEGSSSGADNQFEVKLLTQPSATVTVDLTVSGDSDVTLDNASLTFTNSSWDDVQTITVRAAQDDDGIDDSATINLNASGADYGSVTGSLTVKVTDDATAALNVSSASLTVEEGNDVTFEIKLDTQPSAQVTVTFTQPSNTDVKVDTDTSTPAVNDNTLTFTNSTYVSSPGTSCTNEWNCPRTVTVSAIVDDDAGDDTANIGVSAAGGDYEGLTVTGGISVSVTDPQNPELELSPTTTLTVGEGETLTFTVKLMTQPTENVTVTIGNPSNSDLTVDDTDLATPNKQNTLTFTTSTGVAGGWNRTQTVTLRAAEDDDAQDDSSISVSVSAAGGDYAGLTATVSAEIDDDDTRGLKLTLTQSGDEVTSVSIDEGSSATLYVALTAAPVGGDVTVTIPDPSGDDFTVDTSPVSGNQNTLEFTADNWDTPQSVTVSAAEDPDAFDDSAEFTLNTSASDSGSDYGAETAVITLTADDDEEPGVVITSSGTQVTSVFMTEGQSVTVGVSLKAPPATGSVTVTLPQPSNTDVKVDTDTSTPDVYDSTLTFTAANWNVPENARISAIVDEDAVSDSLTIEMTALGVASSGYELSGETFDLRVVVRETDQAAVNVSTGSLSFAEGASATFTVALGAPPTADVEVMLGAPTNSDISLSGDTLSDDRELTFTTANYSDPQSVTVSAIHDDDFDDDSDSIAVQVSASTDPSYGSLVGATVATVAVEVTDDEDAGLTLSPSSLMVTEGLSKTFEIELSALPSGDVTVTLSAPGNSEITLSGTTLNQDRELTFTSANWNTAQTVTVSAAHDDDAVDEAVETISIAASGANYGDGTTVTEDFEITVEDDENLGFVFTDDDGERLDGTLEVDEGASESFGVRLSSLPVGAGNVTVELTTVQTQAISISPASLTFTAGNWDAPQSVSITGRQDPDPIDDPATVSLAASGANYGDGTTVTDSISVTVDDDEVRSIVIDPTGKLTVVEGGTETFTVALGSQPTGAVSVSVSVASGPVTVSSTSLSFNPANWDEPKTVTVSGSQDGNAVTDAAAVGLAASGADYGDGTTVTASVNFDVTDDDGDDLALTVSKSSLDVDEGGTQTFTVELSHQPAGNVVLTVTSGDTGAATVDEAELTFTTSNWNAAQTVTVTGVEDADAADEEDVTITVNVKAGSSSEYLNVGGETVGVTVKDDETPGLTVSPAMLEVDEGATGTFTVQLAHIPTRTVTVAVSSGDTSVATVSPNELTFTTSNWDDVQTVTVTSVSDVDAADDSATITLNPSGGEYDDVDDANVTVNVDDDEDPSLLITGSPVTVEEGDTDSSVTVRPAVEPTGTVRLTFSAANSAILGVPTALEFTTSNWETPQAVSLEAFHDDGSANNSTELTITASGGEYDDVEGTVTVNITDEDIPGLMVSPSSGFTVNEGSTNTFTVQLTTQPSGSVTLTLSSSDDNVARLDRAVNNSRTLGFDSGNWDMPQTVIVFGREDGNDTDEEFTIEIDPSGAEYQDVDTFSLNGETDDDDSPGLKLSSAVITELGEGGDSKTFQVKLNTLPAGNVNVAVESTRTASVTVSPVSASLTFTTSNWDDFQTVTLTAPEDPDAIDNVVSVRLTTASSADADYANISSSVRVTTDDDDDATVKISKDSIELEDDLDVDENGRATFEVYLSAQPTGEVRIRVTSDDANVATASPASLTFTSSQWNEDDAQTVTVTGIDDNDFQNERATISLTASGAAEFNGEAASVEINVDDDDGAKLRLSAPSLSVDDNSDATFTVQLDALPTADVNVTLASADTNLATVSPATLTFTTANWDDEVEVTVTGVKDDNASNDSTSLTLTASGGGFGSTQTLAVTVVDTDVRGVILDPDTGFSLDEGDSGRFSVALATQPTGQVELELTIDSENAQAVTFTPNSLTFGVSDWDDPQFVSVTAIEDDDIADSSTTIDIDASGADYADVEASLDVAIEDVDEPGLTASKTNVLLSENASGNFTVALAQKPSGDVSVEVASANTAVATVSPAALTFSTTTWNAPQLVTVLGTDDDNATNDTARINLTASGADYGGVTKSLTASVSDDDSVGLSVSSRQLQVTEGLSGTFTVRLNTEPSDSVSITVASGNPAVATVTPALPDTLNFSTSNWNVPQNVTVTGVQDEDISDGEASITLQAAGGDYAGQSASVAVTVKDDDLPAIVLTHTDLSLTEGERYDVGVTLSSLPTGEVRVEVSSNSNALELSTQSMVFTRDNWGDEQTLRVTASEDDDARNDTGRITLVSSGGGSDSVPRVITVAVDDNDETGLRLEPAELELNENAVGTFTVELTSQPTGRVVLEVFSSDGAAAEATPARLTFRPGNWDQPQTVTVSALDDADFSDESVEVNLSATGADYENITAAARVQIIDDDEGADPEIERVVISTSLAAVGNSVLTSSMDVISQRFNAGRSQRTATLAGRQIDLGDARSALQLFQTGGDPNASRAGSQRYKDAWFGHNRAGDSWLGGVALLNGQPVFAKQHVEKLEIPFLSGFSYALNANGESGEGSEAGGAQAAVWGRYNERDFSGQLEDTSKNTFRGFQRGSWLGYDQQLDQGLTYGVALARSSGESDYTVESYDGRIETRLTSIQPYIEFPAFGSGSIRLIYGMGSGAVDVMESSGVSGSADLSMEMFSLGGSWPVARWGDRTTLSSVSSVSSNRLTTARSTAVTIADLNVSSERIRSGFELVHDGFGIGMQFRPRFGLTVRRDGGDGINGTGLEATTGVQISTPNERVSLDFSGYALWLHTNVDLDEWGASVELEVKSRLGGRGVSLSIGPEWGQQRRDVLGEEQPFDLSQSVLADARASEFRTALSANLGYGVDLFGGLLTPYAQYSFVGSDVTSVRYTTGMRFKRGEDFSARLFGEQNIAHSGDVRSRLGFELSKQF